jgi:diguanylate cyclase (GGDEF)-like protein
MAVLDWMQPRDHGAAGQTVALLCGVGVTVTVATFPFLPQDTAGANPVLAASAAAAFTLVVLITGLIRFMGEASRVAWAVCPLLAVAAIVLVDLATHDASIRAQIFFVFSTLYGGALLPRPGAIVMTVWSLLGEAVVVLAFLSLRDAATGFMFMGAAVATTAILLVRSAERQAAMMAVLEKHATTDPLTGLVTRRFFDVATEAALSGPTGPNGTALILLDVDRFKTINDRFGHPGGDEILVQLSELLVTTSRRGDVVCRLGGDELAVLLPDCSVEAAQRRVEEMVMTVRLHDFVVGVLGPPGTVKVSVSAGLAHCPTNAQSAQALYAAADSALYEAKRTGRDRAVAHAAPAALPAS